MKGWGVEEEDAGQKDEERAEMEKEGSVGQATKDVRMVALSLADHFHL